MASPRMQAAKTSVGRSCQPGTAATRMLQQVVPLCMRARQDLMPACLKAGLEYAEAHEQIRQIVIDSAARLGLPKLVAGVIYDRLECLRIQIQEGL